MKNIFRFIFLIYCYLGVTDVSAQDKIMLVNGDSIVGSVIKVSSAGIKYTLPGFGDFLFNLSQSKVKKLFLQMEKLLI